ncbi:hypothetical protein V8F33_009513 [Rhypophila sp. PSN 637]
MPSGDLKFRLRTGTPKSIRQMLDQAVTESDNPSSLTKPLLEWIDRGDLPPALFATYIRVSKDPAVLVAALNQSKNASVRLAAINSLGLRLRSASDFRPTWDVLGGPAGVSSLMKTLNLKDLARLCRVLGDTYRFAGARDAREQEMSQLLRLLCDLDPDKPNCNSGVTIIRDPRLPAIRHVYEQIVKACGIDMRVDWIPDKRRPTYVPPTILQVLGHCPSCADSAMIQARILQQVFDEKHKTVRLSVFPMRYPCDRSFINTLLKDRSFINMFLKRLAEEIPCDWKFDRPEDFFRKLASPNASWLQNRRRSSSTNRYVFWNMVLVCLRKFPDLAPHLGFDNRSQGLHVIHDRSGGFWIRAVSWWASTRTVDKRARVAQVLQSLLELIPEDMGLSCHLYLEMFRCAKVRVVLRSELLRLLFQHQKMYGFDIESPGNDEKARMKDLLKLPLELLYMMLPERAVELHNLMLELDPNHKFVASQYPHPPSIFTKTKDYQPDTLLFRAHFQSRLPADSSKRDSVLDHTLAAEVGLLKEKAAKAKPRGLRPLWLRSALLLSIARGSLEGYFAMLQWASQFDNDGVSARTTYGPYVLGTKEGIQLLCGIPDAEAVSCRTVAEVKESIEAANTIILSLFEQLERAAEVQDGEEGQASIWTYAGSFPLHVVMRRLRHVNTFQSYWKLSDDEVYEKIWQPTLEMLVTTERFRQKEQNERFGYSRLEGPLGLTDYPPLIGELRNPAWLFFDNLAKERDLIWTAQSESAHATRQPRLPVQYLLPFIGGGVGRWSYKLPYMVSRATEVLFSDKQSFLDPPYTKDKILDVEFRNELRACIIFWAHGQLLASPKDGDDRVLWLWNHLVNRAARGIIASAGDGPHVFEMESVPSLVAPLDPKLNEGHIRVDSEDRDPCGALANLWAQTLAHKHTDKKFLLQVMPQHTPGYDSRCIVAPTPAMKPSLPTDGTSQGNGEEARPILWGWFAQPSYNNMYGLDTAQQCKRANHFRYRITALHLPVEHHYMDRDRKRATKPPLEDFAKYNFSWRRNHRRWFTRSRSIDFNSHPTIDGVTMFVRRQFIDFGTPMLRWTAEIAVWRQDPQAWDRELTDGEVASMFNENTYVCMEAFSQEKTAGNPLRHRRRVFVKYPKERELSESTGSIKTPVDHTDRHLIPESNEDTQSIKTLVASIDRDLGPGNTESTKTVVDSTDQDPVPESIKTHLYGIDHDLVHVLYQNFCVHRDTSVQLEDPVLYKVIEENIERQLFFEEPAEEPRINLREPSRQTEILKGAVVFHNRVCVVVGDSNMCVHGPFCFCHNQ